MNRLAHRISWRTAAIAGLVPVAAAGVVTVSTAAGAATLPGTPPVVTAQYQPPPRGHEVRKYVPGRWEQVPVFRYSHRMHREIVIRYRWVYVPGYWVTITLPGLPGYGQPGQPGFPVQPRPPLGVQTPVLPA